MIATLTGEVHYTGQGIAGGQPKITVTQILGPTSNLIQLVATVQPYTGILAESVV